MKPATAVAETSDSTHVDTIIVGAGIGGVCAIHRFLKLGHRVQALEAGSGIGGVWFHNRYPGARVDLESIDYCYFFSDELQKEWVWSERYATQPELMAYLNHVADRFDLRRHIAFNTRMTGARWQAPHWHVTTSDGRTLTCRFLVMCTGNLSAARQPPFPGLDRYKGEWIQTSHWPDRPVRIAGRRVGYVGTGSTSVQAIPLIAREAKHLHVFQRSPNFSVPAHNRPVDRDTYKDIRGDMAEQRALLLKHPGGTHLPINTRPASDFTPAEQQAMLEQAWAHGGHAIVTVFSDQAINKDVNDLVSEFVRNKIRSIVKDPAVAEKLCPYDHPIGTRRLCVDTGYYETFNRPNVTLVDVKNNPILEATETGLRTACASYDFDLMVFAIGFEPFFGQYARAPIYNDKGETPLDRWKRGPRTLLGIMTHGFPNLFFPTGPGSPGVLANMFLGNEQHIDWIADLIAHMDKVGAKVVEPKLEAEAAWTEHVAEVSKPTLRLKAKNYMVHVNADDQSRVFIPYIGGFHRYVEKCDAEVASGYAGFAFA